MTRRCRRKSPLFAVLLGLLLPPVCLLAAAARPGPLDIISSRLQVNNPQFASVLRRAKEDAEKFGLTTSLSMGYRIFRGESSLRSLTDKNLELLINDCTSFVTEKRNPTALSRASALLFLLQGNLEAAHEIVLGVTPENADKAEFAATHPGETSWSDDHPLSDSADMIHAAIHRLEGAAIGEGNHTGYENAKFWTCGGPKKLQEPAQTAVTAALAKRALQYAPLCVARGVVAECEAAVHCIIAGGGEYRTVRVSSGQWDGIQFINLCRLRAEGQLSQQEDDEVADLQRSEMLLLLEHELTNAGLVGSSETRVNEEERK